MKKNTIIGIAILAILLSSSSVLATTSSDLFIDEPSRIQIKVGSPTEPLAITPINIPTTLKAGETVVFEYEINSIPVSECFKLNPLDPDPCIYYVQALSHAPGVYEGNNIPACLGPGYPAFFRDTIKYETFNTNTALLDFLWGAKRTEQVAWTVPSNIQTSDYLRNELTGCTAAICHSDPAYSGEFTCDRYYLLITVYKMVGGEPQILGGNIGRLDFEIESGSGEVRPPCPFDCCKASSIYQVVNCPTGQVCIETEGAGSCVEQQQCSKDADCGTGQKCVSPGVCIQSETPQDYTLYLIIGVIIAAAIVIILAIYKRRGPGRVQQMFPSQGYGRFR